MYLLLFPIIVVMTISASLNISKYKYLLMCIACNIYRNYNFIDVIILNYRHAATKLKKDGKSLILSYNFNMF